MRLNKYWLYETWLDLAKQHFRAGNATMYVVCVINACRVYNTYLR